MSLEAQSNRRPPTLLTCAEASRRLDARQQEGEACEAY